MRFALVSDLHANLQAWNAVLLDIRSQKIEKIICLGDIVGYGPNPAEVLQSAYTNVDHFVLGNHDAVICGKMDVGLFNERARGLIEWTKTRLGPNAMEFLGTLPLTLDAGTFRCAHGDFSDPAAFNYVIDAEDALPSWQAVDTPLLFVGHSHWPALYVLAPNGTAHRLEPGEFTVQPPNRYLVNVGSVGHPRDGEAGACYCIFDSDAGAGHWRRIPFDLDAYRSALCSAGLPEETSAFLRHDPRLGKPPLREQLNFSPARTAAEAAKDVIPVQQITELTRRVSRWRLLALIFLAIAATSVCAGIWMGWRQTGRRMLRIADPSLHPIHARAYPPRESLARSRSPIPHNANLLTFPASPVVPGMPVQGWEILLGDRRHQRVGVEEVSGQGLAFFLESSTLGSPVCLSTPLILIEPGQRFKLHARFREPDSIEGNYAVYIETVDRHGRSDPEWLRLVPGQAHEGRRVAQKVFPEKSGRRFPNDAVGFRLQIRGKFRGRIHVDQVGLGRIE